ncbi:uncharacterized protein PAC_16214 [Phialocephala subalpina]|uniref:Ubiquitin-like protease family profile domain-containing protein n=1 Tax=Phialocephala subalpina TaxID=576137 RepID=A0A1L7XMR4_9HELO|nr:uncharacterized protein PAC_16214 [Phialocephala subalpina]
MNESATWDGFCRDYSKQQLRDMLDQLSINTQHVKLNKRDVLYIFSDAAGLDPDRDFYYQRWNLSKPTVRTYAQCICRYVNQRRIRYVASPSQDLESGNVRLPAERSRSRSPISGSRRHGYRQRDPIEPVRTSNPNLKSCAVISPEDYNLIISRTNPGARTAEITKILTALNITGDDFWGLDYLFLPFLEHDRKHWILAGIAPKQEFFLPADTKREWPLYGQWSRRSMTDDESPDVPKQTDGYNCGVFALTNLFCLAFGYDLLCYEQADLTPLKRPNIVEELRNGGLGENGRFKYPLLDLPGNHYTLLDPNLKASSYYPHRKLADPSKGTGDGNIGRMSAFSFSPEVDPMDTADEDDDFPPPEAPSADDDDDLEEQHALPPTQLPAEEKTARVKAGMLPNPRQLDKFEITKLLAELGGHQACKVCNAPALPSPDPWDSAGSDDEVTDEEDDPDSDTGEDDGGETPKPILTATQQYAAFRRILDGPDSDSKDDLLKQLKEMDNRPWPPQFNKYRHQKAGFIYANISLPDGCGEVPPSSRKFLRDGCRNFPIKGVKEWRNAPRAAIRTWAESEMSAFMARALDEVETKPYPGIGRGYERWKAGLGEEESGGSDASSESTADESTV